jgi:hypothetical protein
MKTASLLLAILRGTSGLVRAHHGSHASYELTQEVTLKGVIKEFVYVNPHIYFIFKSERR